MLNSLGLYEGSTRKFLEEKLNQMASRAKWGDAYPYVMTAHGPVQSRQDYIDPNNLGISFDDTGMVEVERGPGGWSIKTDGMKITTVGRFPVNVVRECTDIRNVSDQSFELVAFGSGRRDDYPGRPDILVVSQYDKVEKIFRIYYFVG